MSFCAGVSSDPRTPNLYHSIFSCNFATLPTLDVFIICVQQKRTKNARNLTYDASWKKKHSWMNHDSTLKGMVCAVCKVYGKLPVHAKGA